MKGSFYGWEGEYKMEHAYNNEMSHSKDNVASEDWIGADTTYYYDIYFIQLILTAHSHSSIHTHTHPHTHMHAFV